MRLAIRKKGEIIHATMNELEERRSENSVNSRNWASILRREERTKKKKAYACGDKNVSKGGRGEKGGTASCEGLRTKGGQGAICLRKRRIPLCRGPSIIATEDGKKREAYT